jgi:hypothetical protein
VVSNPTCTLETDSGWLKLRINGLLHLRIKLDAIVGIQSWYEGDEHRTYYLEFTTKYPQEILSVYESRDLWADILKLLDGM